MKIKPEHFQHIYDAVSKYVVGNRSACVAHKATVNPARFRWDLFNASGLTSYACDSLYSYLNDEHIDTAMRCVVRQLFQ